MSKSVWTEKDFSILLLKFCLLDKKFVDHIGGLIFVATNGAKSLMVGFLRQTITDSCGPITVIFTCLPVKNLYRHILY